MRPRILPALLLLAAALVAEQASAQSRPELPERARIRIAVLRTDSLGATMSELRGIAVVHRADADSIAFRLDRSDEILIAPWARVQELEVSDGTRPYTIGEHLGSTAIFTIVGAGLGYSSWHSCNDPESDEIWSCILSPRYLSTSVRTGAWVGLAVGLIDVLVNREEETWRNVLHPSGPRLLIGHSARSGFRLGASLKF